MSKFERGDTLEYRLGHLGQDPHVGIYMVLKVRYKRSWRNWFRKIHTGYNTLTWYPEGAGGTTTERSIYHKDGPGNWIPMPAGWWRHMFITKVEIDDQIYNRITNEQDLDYFEVRKLSPLEIMMKMIEPLSEDQLKRYDISKVKWIWGDEHQASV